MHEGNVCYIMKYVTTVTSVLLNGMKVLVIYNHASNEKEPLTVSSIMTSSYYTG